MSAPVRAWTVPPSRRETLFVSVAALLSCALTLELLDNFWTRAAAFTDNPTYLETAAALRAWAPGAATTDHFWGLPYAVALVAEFARLTDLVALVVICVTASLTAVALAHALWGGWVAILFATLSWAWIQRSTLGGTEPLFAAALFGSFVAARRDRWRLSALVAALATIVRPLGVFALAGLAVELVMRRRWTTLAGAFAIAAVVGVAYVVPFALLYGDPLANVHAYQIGDWHAARPIGLPFAGMLTGLLASPEPLTNTVKVAAWVTLVLAGAVAALASPRGREEIARYPMEWIFAAVYFLFLICYNAPLWAWVEFPRFAVPLLPFVLVPLVRDLRIDRRLIWALAPISGIVAAMSALNVRHALEVILDGLTA